MVGKGICFGSLAPTTKQIARIILGDVGGAKSRPHTMCAKTIRYRKARGAIDEGFSFALHDKHGIV